MKRFHRCILSVSSGVLLSLPWLGFPGWMLFFAFVPLLYLENYFVKFKAGFPPVSFWGHVFLSAVIWNVLASWWMTKVSLAGVGAAMVFNTFLMACVWWLAHTIHRKFSALLGYIALISLWIAFEYLQFNWDIEWPCLQLGSILATNIQLIQWYEFTGTFGGTLWILLLNIFLFKFVLHYRLKSSSAKKYITLAVFLIFLGVPALLSVFMYHNYYEEEDPVSVCIVQPNVDPYTEKFDWEAEQVKLNQFIRLAAEQTNGATDFILAPETIFEHQTLWNIDEFSSNSFLLRLQLFLKQYDKAEMVFGISSYKVYKEPREYTTTARTANGLVYDRFNTALQLNKAGETQFYHKSKLVAGVEKVPYQNLFSGLKNSFIDIGGTTGTLGRQNEAKNFISKSGICVAPVICFESVFGAYVASYVQKGAQVIFVITNDGWWKNSRGYKLHLLFSQLRAVETRRSIARAANTGTSCFISQRGEVLQATNWWEEAVISGQINKNEKLTFYTLHGDFVARLAVFCSVLIMLLMFVRKFR
ncbi:apolipoprotein N-acyltransferase [uncultured Draconibacterium sp.]|uniref:apolipoprotein N-acyltransferase n=1 Tax=uncultured Draconibacterium sp. TaxID=1573823 RepID=UPI003260F718